MNKTKKKCRTNKITHIVTDSRIETFRFRFIHHLSSHGHCTASTYNNQDNKNIELMTEKK